MADAPKPWAAGESHSDRPQIALTQKVVQGRKMRIDTTVAESNIHHPTDSSRIASPEMLPRTTYRFGMKICLDGAQFRVKLISHSHRPEDTNDPEHPLKGMTGWLPARLEPPMQMSNRT